VQLCGWVLHTKTQTPAGLIPKVLCWTVMAFFFLESLWCDYQIWNVCYKNLSFSWVPVAHACNPSYSGGRYQKNSGSKPAWANNLRDPIKKKVHHKKGLAEWLKW
jgi:hypothetical protein